MTITEKVLICNNDPKIRSVNSDEIGDMLVYIYQLIGLSKENVPKPVPLISYIKQSLGYYTVQDFINAFTFMIQGKLDDKVEHYNNFSMLYLERVMQSYSRLRYPIVEGSKNTDPFEVKLTSDEARNIILNGIRLAFERHKQGKTWFDYGGVKYKYLLDNDIITLTEERKNEFYTKAQKSGDVSMLKNLRAKEDLINDRAGELAIEEWFCFLTENEMDVNELLN